MAGQGKNFAKYAIIALAALAAIAAAVYFLRSSGRGGGDGRTGDPEYAQELKDVMERRKPLVRERNATVARMQAVIDRARAALPPGATDDEVKAELEGHPDKYPEWKGLNEKIAKDNAAVEGSLKEAQARVRARIMREAGYGKKQ